MSQSNKNVVLVSASPKIGTISVSGFLTDLQENQMKEQGLDLYRIDVRKSLTKGTPENDFQAMLQADAIIFTFPLYIFCLPGLLMRFLQDFFEYQSINKNDHKPYVYSVVNCGFPEAWINQEAVDVIKSFSRSIGATFRFGVLIGGGGMLVRTHDKPFMRKTMNKIVGSFRVIGKDVISKSNRMLENISVTQNFPSRLYYLMGNMGWVYVAKKYGLKKKDLYRQPY